MRDARWAFGDAPAQAPASDPAPRLLSTASPAAPADLAPEARPSAAEARSAQADAAHSRMKRGNRPRGSARGSIVRERTETHQALLEAREHYEALQRRARGGR